MHSFLQLFFMHLAQPALVWGSVVAGGMTVLQLSLVHSSGGGKGVSAASLLYSAAKPLHCASVKAVYVVTRVLAVQPA